MGCLLLILLLIFGLAGLIVESVILAGVSFLLLPLLGVYIGFETLFKFWIVVTIVGAMFGSHRKD